MITASLLAVLTLGMPAALPASTAHYAGDSVRAGKGQPSLPARTVTTKSTGATAVCHPDPGKGRACRHHVSKKEEARLRQLDRAELAEAEVASTPR